MLVRLVRPMKRKESSYFQFTQRIPADILQKVRGQTLALPVGSALVTRRVSQKANVIKLSLRTRDPVEAKIRQAKLLAHLESVWQSYRNGPRKLTHKENVALAGEVYRALVGVLENNPLTPEVWDRVLVAIALARTGKFGVARLLIGDKARRDRAMEARFGEAVDSVLRKHALVVDDESRHRLREEVARILDLVALRLRDNASGDYSPDDILRTFPEWTESKREEAKQVGAPREPEAFQSLLQAWWKESEAAGLSERTYREYSRTFRQLADFLGHDDVKRVTSDDVIRFKDFRLGQINPRSGKPVSPKTVKDSDLTALKSVFGWMLIRALG